MRRSRLAVGLLLVLSGCLAPPVATSNEPDRIEVRNGGLPVDADAVYERMRNLLGTDVDPPDSVRVVDPSKTAGEPDPVTGGIDPPPFWSVMGVTPKSGDVVDLEEMVQGITNGQGGITIYLGDNETSEVHYVLAHELVHYVQFTDGSATSLGATVGTFSTDGGFVVRSMLEGVAVYATDRYVERYVPGQESNSALYLQLRERFAPGSVARFGNSQYIYGARYVAGRLDSPNQTERIYENPPLTSEQVIHGYLPSEEPIANLSVSVEPNGWDQFARDRLGEAFVRVALQNGLDRPAADRAAAGWGNDTLRIYRRSEQSDRKAYFWVVRWDDPANATEFAEAFRTTLDARGDRTNDTWTVEGNVFDVRTVAPDTTVVVAGSERFVANASVEGTSGDVSLTLPEGESEVGVAAEADPPAYRSPLGAAGVLAPVPVGTIPGIPGLQAITTGD